MKKVLSFLYTEYLFIVILPQCIYLVNFLMGTIRPVGMFFNPCPRNSRSEWAHKHIIQNWTAFLKRWVEIPTSWLKFDVLSVERVPILRYQVVMTDFRPKLWAGSVQRHGIRVPRESFILINQIVWPHRAQSSRS